MRTAWPVLLSCASVFPAGCVQLQINEERFHAPNVVQGYPRDLGALASRNQDLLTKPLPTRRPGKDGDAASEVPHPGRLWDPDASPIREPPPGGRNPPPLSFAQEWVFNRFYGKDAARGKNEPPRLCVAMSGGGIRSASFNIGVLSALQRHETKILDRVDVLSAVSGGAYALSWYYAQHHIDATLADPQGPARLENALFQEGHNYQRHLQKNGIIFNRPTYYAIGAGNLAATPLNLLANGIFGWHMNTNPARDIYEWRLQEVFQQPPPKKEGEAVPELERVPAIHFDDLRRTIEERRLPYFVINTTAFLEDSSDHFGAPLYNSIYEFTPLFFGADALGRYTYDPARPEFPVTFARAVSISGAALDGTKLIVGSSQRTLWSLLNQDLGYHMDNPAISGDRRIVHLFMPFPIYYFHHYPRDLHGTNIYLSDGGHSENLGAYALVRRLCERIIVVDAEHDPTYEFEAYYNLKRALRRDMGVDLYVPDLERIAQDERSLRQIRIDALVRDPAPMPPVQPADAADLQPAPQSDASNDRQLYPSRVTMDLLASKRWKEVAATPTMHGCIAYLPYPGRKPVLSITYLKLAYAQTEEECKPVDDYRALQCPENSWNSWESCMLHLENEQNHRACGFDRDEPPLGEIAPGCKSLWHARKQGLLTKTDQGQFLPDHSRIYFCRKRETADLRKSPYARFVYFPQQPTTDQDFDQWQFKAYRHLGYHSAMQALDNFDIDAEPKCPGSGLQ
jgi:hypothetical protein